jgi:hypothetical protein
VYHHDITPPRASRSNVHHKLAREPSFAAHSRTLTVRRSQMTLSASLVALALATPLDALAQQPLAAPCAPDPRLLPAAVRAASASDAERARITTDALREVAEAHGLAAPSLRLWIGRGTDAALTHEINLWLRSQPLDPRVCLSATASSGSIRAVVIAPRSAEFAADVRRDETAATTVRFTARFAVATRGAHVVLSAPNGRSFVAELDRAHVLPTPGAWVAQLIANADDGPIPWARRSIVVEGAQPEPSQQPRVTGPIRDARSWLVELNRARLAAGAPTLRADPVLQSIANERAATRARLAAVAHTLSEDDAPDAHLRREHVRAEQVAENVARASTLDEAFARLDRSPSHRRARMERSFDAAAIAAVRAADGWYVVELFALRPALLP